MRTKLRPRAIVFLGLLFLVVLILIVVTQHHGTQTAQTKTSSSSSLTKDKAQKSDLPSAHLSDWNLILVNRQHPKPELNPNLTQIDNIQVDSRIAKATKDFLEAAQKVDLQEHLISGYRSVAYQTQLYNSYIENEMVGGAGAVNDTGQPISRTQAIKNVQTYGQPPESSEHETGLAIDMSDVDALNQSSAAVVDKISALAPNYGFILRFTKEGAKSTGVQYEDWHYRYVGIANAKYMAAHHLTLEEYLKLLAK